MWRWFRELLTGHHAPSPQADRLLPTMTATAYRINPWNRFSLTWRDDVLLLASGRAPGGLRMPATLDLAGLRLRSLPANLTVDGDLDLRQCQRLRRIGDGLHVGGRLDLGGARPDPLPWIAAIESTAPEHRHRFWSAPIFARPSRDGQCPIESLPARLRVGGDLLLRSCRRLTTLPTDMDVGGSITVEGSYWFDRLPDPFEVRGDLTIIGAPRLRELPASLTVKGSLRLVGVGVASLPAGLRVGGVLTLQDCARLDRLPDGLAVGGSLTLRACPIARLPDDLAVGGDLVCDRLRELTAIPEGLAVAGRVKVVRCPRIGSS